MKKDEKFISMAKFENEMIFLTNKGSVYQMFFDQATDIPVFRKIYPLT